MPRPNCLAIVLAAFLAIGSIASSLRADGGAVQGQRSVAGWDVFLYSHPGTLRAGPNELSVFLQNRGGREPVLDADVMVHVQAAVPESGSEWIPPCCRMKVGSGAQAASRSGGGNRLFYRAPIVFGHSGEWTVTVSIRRGEESAIVEFPVRVEPPAPPLLAYWPMLFLPVVAVGGFMWRERLLAGRGGHA